jgi:hypothetical protein
MDVRPQDRNHSESGRDGKRPAKIAKRFDYQRRPARGSIGDRALSTRLLSTGLPSTRLLSTRLLRTRLDSSDRRAGRLGACRFGRRDARSLPGVN